MNHGCALIVCEAALDSRPRFCLLPQPAPPHCRAAGPNVCFRTFLMPHISSAELKSNYDVIVVGSGAGGGQTAYTLAMEGVKVLMLEAGRNYDPMAETPMFQDNSRAPLRGAGTTDKPFGFYDATVDGGWQVPGEPYTQASNEPGRQFEWWRARMLGGRTNHWGRISLRNGPYDFKPYSRDGLGFDWPMTYEDLAPYYDRVEMLIGVYGDNDGLENTPNSSPGVLQPPPKARAGELYTQRHAKKLGLPVIAIHRAVLSMRQDSRTLPAKLHPNNPTAQRILAQAMNERAACFWATACGRGCSIKANYQSTTVHLPPALASGNLDILSDAMVREVTMDDAGKATGVAFIERKSRGRCASRRGSWSCPPAPAKRCVCCSIPSPPATPPGWRTQAARWVNTSWIRWAPV
jgi:choline dehydrogenase-like flavoprotein